jgi:hypothetical protein
MVMTAPAREGTAASSDWVASLIENSIRGFHRPAAPALPGLQTMT